MESETVVNEPVKLYGPKLAILALVSYFVGSLLSGLFGGIVIGIAAAAKGKDTQDPQVVQELIAQANPALTLVGMVAGVLTLLLFTKLYLRDLKANSHDSGLRPVARKWLLVSGAVGALLGLMFLTLAGLNPPEASFEPGPLMRMASSSSAGLAVWTVLAILLAPPVEEFLFRGILFTGFSRKWGNLVAAALVSLVFVGLHWGEAGGYPPALFAISALALGTVIVRIKSGSIWPAVSLHFAYNSVLAVTAVASAWLPNPAAEASQFVTAGQYREAVQALDQAILAEPDNAQLYFLRAFSKAELQQRDESLQDYDEGLSLQPEAPAEILNAKAYLLAEVGRYEEALSISKKSLALSPNAPAYLNTLDYIYVGLEDYEHALEAYDEALDHDPDLAACLYGQAVCYRELGDEAGAEAGFARAKALEPDLKLEWKVPVSMRRPTLSSAGS